MRWNARQVFYKQNMASVAARQRRMFEEAVAARAEKGVDTNKGSPEVGEVDIEFVGDDGAKDDKPAATERPLTPFHFFQRAITHEFSRLDDDEVKEYEDLAAVWNEEGPSDIEKKRYVNRNSDIQPH